MVFTENGVEIFCHETTSEANGSSTFIYDKLYQGGEGQEPKAFEGHDYFREFHVTADSTTFRFMIRNYVEADRILIDLFSAIRTNNDANRIIDDNNPLKRALLWSTGCLDYFAKQAQHQP